MELTPSDRARHLEDHAALQGLRRSIRTLQVEAAGRFARIQRTGSFLFHAATSIGEYGEKSGWCAMEARLLASTGEALEKVPTLAEGMIEGLHCPEKVASFDRVLQDPSLVRPDDDWPGLLSTLTARNLRDEVRRRQAENRSGMAFPLKAWLSPAGAESFLRTREITVRKAGRPLTEGESLEMVFDDYLDRHDPVRQAARAAVRGVVADPDAGPTVVAAPGPDRTQARTRALPAAEKHALLLRDGDRCTVEGCDERVTLENAHRVPFRRGGANTARNLLRLCRRHHELLDSGTWKIVGSPGREVLVDRTGTVVGRLRPPLPRTDPPAPPHLPEAPAADPSALPPPATAPPA